MKVKIWGSRGSIPTPLKPGQIEEKIARAIHHLPPKFDTSDLAAVQAYVQGLSALQRGTAGGNTTCVEIEAAGKTLVIDAGTGIRELGLDLMDGPFGRGEGELHLFFSHPHWDHIQGFPFFNPAYIQGNRIFIYSIHDLNMALVDQQRFLYFPVPMSIMTASIEFVRLVEGEPFNIGDVRINTIRNAHPGHSYGFRFEDEHSVFVFASDSEYKELTNGSVQPYITFFKGADALIFDAQYTLNEGWIKEDWGHSSAMIGVDMALAAGVKRLILFHHDPTHDDEMLHGICSVATAYRDEIANANALEILSAYEGMVLDLTGKDSLGNQSGSRQTAPILISPGVFDEQSVQLIAEKLGVFNDQASYMSRIIDLSNVETLTTASLKQLVQLQQAEERVPLILASPSPSAMRVIELGGFSDFFAIFPTVETAQVAVAAREKAQLPGQVLGNRYLIKRVLAERQMGTVLEAIDQHQGVEVAVRIIDPAFSDAALQRLFRYRDQLLKAEHPNLLRIHALAREDHTTYIIEDYHAGQSLVTFLEKYPGGLPLAKGMDIALEIVTGLAYAHGEGIVHSNLSSEKVFIDGRGIKIGGMALGHLEGNFNMIEVPFLRRDASFLAPEQILGQPIDARTDLYALGVILYQLFTGHVPFHGQESDILKAHISQDPISPRMLNEQIPPSLDFLLTKLLAKNPAQRYRNAAQVRPLLLALNLGQPFNIQEERTSIAGRDGELKQLAKSWIKAQSGEGQLIIISGEPEVGKTRLAKEFAKQSQAPVVLYGRCLEGRSDQAFYPIAAALMDYLATLPPELFDKEAQQLINQFAHVVPRVEKMIPGLISAAPLPPEQEQLRSISSLARFIALSTTKRPWIIIIDDLHWADDGSLALLRHLCLDLAKMPILIIGTVRKTVLEQASKSAKLIQELNNYPFVSQIEIARLDNS